MNCCADGAFETAAAAPAACQMCGETGKIVARQTVVHHITAEKLSCVVDVEFRFCSSADCDVVFYSDHGIAFTVDDVREPITSKTSGDCRPLCYCFGFTEGNVRRELLLKGETTIPAQVTQFVKEKLCACEVRNPSGSCCLGEINRTVKRLCQATSQAASENAIK